MNINRLTPTTTEINIEFEHGKTQSVMISSNHHWDNPQTDRALLKKDLQRAIDEDMPIISLGDLFCAMQGRGDRRGTKGDLLPEHKVGDYLDALSDTATDWYAP